MSLADQVGDFRRMLDEVSVVGHQAAKRNSPRSSDSSTCTPMKPGRSWGASMRRTSVVEIDHDGPVPPFRQLAAVLRMRLKAGEISPGERIPSEAQIHAATGLARTTIRRAVAVLVAEGLVEVVPQRGVYVVDQADE